jgi:hypothetical protein
MTTRERAVEISAPRVPVSKLTHFKCEYGSPAVFSTLAKETHSCRGGLPNLHESAPSDRTSAHAESGAR